MGSYNSANCEKKPIVIEIILVHKDKIWPMEIKFHPKDDDWFFIYWQIHWHIPNGLYVCLFFPVSFEPVLTFTGHLGSY